MHNRVPLKRDTFQSLLSTYMCSELRELAHLLDITISDSKDYLVQSIKDQLTKPEIIIQLWQDLDSIQKQAVAETLYSPFNLFPKEQFRAKYGVNPDWGNAQPGKKLTHPSKLCLFIHKMQIPRELKNLLAGFVSRPEKIKIPFINELPLFADNEYVQKQNCQKNKMKKIIRLNTEYAAMHELPLLFSALDRQDVKMSSIKENISRTGLNELQKLFYGGDYLTNAGIPENEMKKIGPIKAYAWVTIFKNLNLATIEDSVLKLTCKGKELWHKPFYESVKQMWNEWLFVKTFDEFSRISCIKGQNGKGKRYLTDVTDRRLTIINALSACPSGVWISIDELFRFMLAEGFVFYVTTSPETLYITDPLLGHLGYTGDSGWNLAEVRYALVFFFEYMATMGLCDIGYTDPAFSRSDYYYLWNSKQIKYLSRYDGLFYIRINNLGKYCMKLSDEYSQSPFEQTNELKILSNLEIVAVQPLHPGDKYFLGCFGTQRSDNVWELEKERIIDAVEKGFSLPLFINFLAAKSCGKIPDTMIHYLEEIQSRQRSLILNGKAWLIKAESPELARIIINSKHLNSRCMITGEDTIVVPEKAKKDFLRVIHDLGYPLPHFQDTLHSNDFF